MTLEEAIEHAQGCVRNDVTSTSGKALIALLEAYNAKQDAQPVAWTDDQMIRFASMILIQGNRPESIEMRLQTFREHEKLRCNSRPEAKPVAAKLVPLKEINELVGQAMEQASNNGANSISMPDEYVAIAHFCCYPEQYGLAAAPQEQAPADKDAIRNAVLQEAAAELDAMHKRLRGNPHNHYAFCAARVLALQSQPQQVTK